MKFEEYPFLSVIKVNKNEYVGIIQHCDINFISFYDYNVLSNKIDKSKFIKLGEEWWWESNRIIPINLFLGKRFTFFRNTLRVFNSKDYVITMGPNVSLKNIFQKRVKRRQVKLIRKM